MPTITIYIEEQNWGKLENLRRKHGLSRSAMINKVLKEYGEEKENDKAD